MRIVSLVIMIYLVQNVLIVKGLSVRYVLMEEKGGFGYGSNIWGRNWEGGMGNQDNSFGAAMSTLQHITDRVDVNVGWVVCSRQTVMG